MQYIFDGEYYKAVRITGPHHNLLGLSFTRDDNKNIDMVALDAQDNVKGTLLPEDVMKQVCEGVTQANIELNVNYRVRKIAFLQSDTPPVEIYRQLAKDIINRLVSGEPFGTFTDKQKHPDIAISH